ncbi:MAG: hypothetical protein WB791_07840 [Waddliaceae bacterium]
MTKKGLGKTFAMILLGFFVCLVLFIALLPSMASTEWGQRSIISFVNQRIPGHLAIKTFTLSWFGPVAIEEFSLTDPDGNAVLTFDSYTSETPFFKQLRRGPIQGKTSLKSLQATIRPEENGETNLEKSLGFCLFFPISGDPSSLILTDVDAALELPSTSSDWTFIASGQTQYENSSGRFAANIQKNQTQVKAAVQAEHFPSAIIDLILALIKPQWGGIASLLMGKTTDFSFNKTLGDDGATFTFTSQSPRLSADFSGKYGNKTITFDLQGKLQMTLLPPLLRKLANNSFGDFPNPMPLELTIDELSIPTTLFDVGLDTKALENVLMKADLKLPKVEVNNVNGVGDDFTLKDVSLSVTTPENTDYLECRIEGFFGLKDKPVRFVYDFQISKLFALNSLSHKMSTEVRKNSRMCEENWLEGLLHCSLIPSSFRFSFENVPSSLIDIYLGTENRVQDVLGETFTYRIASSANDFNTVRLTLESEKLTIPHLLFSVKGPLDLTNGRVKGAFSGEVQSNNCPELGRVEGEVEIADVMAPRTPSINLTLTGTSIPSRWIGSLVGKEEAGLLFGNVLDLSLVLDYQHGRGPMNIDVKGKQGVLSLRSHLSQHTLTLTKPLELAFRIDPVLGRQCLGQWIPICRELINGDSPIRLTVFPEHFSMSILPFDRQRLHIGKGVLDMGKLHFHHKGIVKKAMDIFRPVRSKTVSLWTTPLYFSMKNGVLMVERMDMLLLDRYELATWGKIDFIRDRIKMVLGISEHALSLAFNIKGQKKEAMIQIPMRGTVDNPKIDHAIAVAHIGSLLAQESDEKKVVEALLDLVKGKKSSLPPPTTQPFPWNQDHLSHVEERRDNED